MGQSCQKGIKVMWVMWVMISYYPYIFYISLTDIIKKKANKNNRKYTRREKKYR